MRALTSLTNFGKGGHLRRILQLRGAALLRMRGASRRGPSAGDGQGVAGGGGEEDASLSIEAGPAAGQVTLTHHAHHGGRATLAAYEVQARRGLPAIAFGCRQSQAEVYPEQLCDSRSM